jgi:hypothetical protein
MSHLECIGVAHFVKEYQTNKVAFYAEMGRCKSELSTFQGFLTKNKQHNQKQCKNHHRIKSFK